MTYLVIDAIQRKRGKILYYKDRTDIGPRFTAERSEAVEFDSPEAARFAVVHPLVFTDVVTDEELAPDVNEDEVAHE